MTFICIDSLIFRGPHSHLLPLFKCQRSQHPGPFQVPGKKVVLIFLYLLYLQQVSEVLIQLGKGEFSVSQISASALGKAEMLFGQL